MLAYLARKKMEGDNRFVYRVVLWADGLIRKYRNSWNGLSVLVMAEDSARPPSSYRINYLILFFMSLKDDLIIMPTRQKLIIQFLVSLLLVFGGVRIMTLHGLFGIDLLPYWLSVITSIIFILGVMNAFNLIDGIDGLAGSVGIICLLFFGGWFMLVGKIHYSFFCFSFAGALLAFLNFLREK